jgi:SpoVK/Ycf46/Vps4 family AAA+-type ATPase
MDRTKGNMQVNTVLTELERHEGLCVLATNRPMDLDEVSCNGRDRWTCDG